MNESQRFEAMIIIKERYIDDILSFVKYGDIGGLTDLLSPIVKWDEWPESLIIDHLNADDIDDIGLE